MTINGVIEAYIHAGCRVGVLVEVRSESESVGQMPEFKTLAHEIALQIAAANPVFVGIKDMPADEVTQMKARYRRDAIDEGKPEGGPTELPREDSKGTYGALYSWSSPTFATRRRRSAIAQEPDAIPSLRGLL